MRLEYTAPAECPDEQAFRHEVESRMKRGRLAEPGELARTFRITLSIDHDKSIARMQFTDADGREASREVTAPTCEEAARAIALVAALAIEERVPEETPKSSRPSSKAPPASSSAVPAYPPPASHLDRDRRLRIGVGALAGAESSFAPDIAPRFEAVLELQRLIVIAPSYADSGPVEIPERGRARFRLYSLSAQAYPLDLGTGIFQLGLGAGFDAGLMHAAGEHGPGIANPNSADKLWLSVLMSVRLSIEIEDTVSLQLVPTLVLPLSRQEFVLENPEVTVHKVPLLGGALFAGAVARFN